LPIPLYLIWFLIGVGFLVAEMMVPGFILIFFTAGCWIVAITVFFLAELALTTQIILFLISSLVLLFTLRRFGLKTFQGESKIEVDAEFSTIGQKAVVTEAIPLDGYGEIQLGGTFWRATAEVAIDKGQRVVVEGEESGNALVLIVKPSTRTTVNKG
jgi:membrane protein implicated in regulation of membrane protease activity